jgi:hypothetical protein
MRRWSFGALAPALGLVVLPLASAPLAAQVEFGPSIGLFWPLGGWTQDFDGDQVQRRHIATGMLSARLAYWKGSRFGLEATVGYSPSQVAVSELSGTQDKTAGVVLSSVRVLTRVLSLTDGDRRDPYHWDFNAGIGAGLISRRGVAWENTTGTTHPAAVLALEARTRFGRLINGRAAVEDFVSWVRFNKGLPSETLARVHHDMLITFALQFQLGAAR